MLQEYTKGTTVAVFTKDSNGQPTSHLERDTDGQLWHVKAGDENAKPRKVREDEVSSLATEEAQRGGHEEK